MKWTEPPIIKLYEALNGSFYVGYLGYPSITFLLVHGVVPFDPKLSELLKGFHWKDINQKFKNDFAKTEAHIRAEIIKRSGVDLAWFDQRLQETHSAIVGLGLNKLPSSLKPPTAY